MATSAVVPPGSPIVATVVPATTVIAPATTVVMPPVVATASVPVVAPTRIPELARAPLREGPGLGLGVNGGAHSSHT